MAGRTVLLVTGATSGIGRETARGLAALGATVLVGARDGARGSAVVEEISSAGGRAELLQVDVASFASIRVAAGRVASAHPALDVLVNNAGIAVRGRELSPDGHELTWATNFLGPFLLTRLLLPQLRAGRGPRVVNGSSEGHRAGRVVWDNPELGAGLRDVPGVCELEAGAEPLHARAGAPGARGRSQRAPSRRDRDEDLAKHARAAPGNPRARAALTEKGARPVIRLAAAPELDGVTGRY